MFIKAIKLHIILNDESELIVPSQRKHHYQSVPPLEMQALMLKANDLLEKMI